MLMTLRVEDTGNMAFEPTLGSIGAGCCGVISGKRAGWSISSLPLSEWAWVVSGQGPLLRLACKTLASKSRRRARGGRGGLPRARVLAYIFAQIKFD